MKSKNKITILTLLFFLWLNIANSQNLKILKDSIYIDNSYVELQELKINSKNEYAKNKIYRIIQSTYDIFDGLYFDTAEKRIKAKKDTISNRILKGTLKESNTGFENYEIYYDRNNIINISIVISSYGLAYTNEQYYNFDLNNGKEIDLSFFINKKVLLKKCRFKLKIEEDEVNISFQLSDLTNFKIIKDDKNNVKEIDFLVKDHKNYYHHANGSYVNIVHFNWKEIEKYISPQYKNRLLKN